MIMQKALYYQKSGISDIKCLLCPHMCLIPEGGAGFCRVRVNNKGELNIPYSGMLAAIALDPIEKKPLTMFMPGSKILSVGGYSCNLRCDWCQNHSISFEKPEMRYIPPDVLSANAAALTDKGNIGVAYTYNEMLIHYEYVLGCAKAVKKAGLKNVLVTNGHLCEEPLRELIPYIDAVNIDIKGFTEEFYKDIKGSLSVALASFSLFAANCHTEVTMLVIPGLNDSPDCVASLAEFLATVGDIPLHLTRFYPRFRMTDKKSPDYGCMLRLKSIASKHLSNVFA